MRALFVRLFALCALLFVATLPACACGMAGGGALICSGGARNVGNGCFCPTGTTFDGTQCQGQPQQGSCGPTQEEVVGANGAVICYCPDGWVWTDQARTTCGACTGGAVASGDSCVCPDGTQWDGQQCAQQAVAQQCTGGAFITDQGCQCPDGTAWDGNQCSAAAQQPQAQQQQVIEQHTVIRNSNVSLTCCINHSRYECPTEQAFQQCSTLQPHTCKPAGGC